ncbi:biotin--[acetyl-CoA-carboxylase] ligase [Leptobacterium flavescens]|uniref:Biotin--[acetyl-CoA-carboxylase] ligase n=1 Tax=Leptobacterium flavescens TaxID=472055 RepID=A0A6P0UKG6_9FLAO|nr:biotin--[acetyl-CoA-carboxylase] ligase [Leptobacterium flavescens]NER12359.1 biotin--[acetyl-CoA-carboxylase] ligase [Leptobacterium flavescens]
MNIIKLDAIDSTNTFLKKLSVESTLEDYTIVIARNQTSGRGQMGTVWSSEAGKNLTFSIYTRVSHVKKDEQFYISIVISLAILKALKSMGIPDLKVKWPNDILSANYKICGILIENIIKGNQLYASVIGIGLNVNQSSFEGLPNASSMKLITGNYYNHEEIVHQIVYYLKKYETVINKRDFKALLNEYESQLFRKDKPSTFKGKDENIFMGFIKGVSTSGKLRVLLEDEIEKEFDLKEVSLLH